jgi:hypothetical protein
MNGQEERSDCIEFRHSSFQLLQRNVLRPIAPLLHPWREAENPLQVSASMRFQTVQFFLQLDSLVH